MKHRQLRNPVLATGAMMLAVMAASSFTSLAEATNLVHDSEAAYTQEINRRAGKIVTALGIADSAQGARVRAILANLTNEQKQKIKDRLAEARELAMDAGSSREKHACFGKYKGRINNYLSAAGYDAKAAERNLKKPDASATDTKPK